MKTAKEYICSYLNDQGTLLKKFNKLLDLFEEFKAIKVYQVVMDFSGYTLIVYINSMTEIKTLQDVLECIERKMVRGAFEDKIIYGVSISSSHMTVFMDDDSYYNLLSELSLDSITYLGDL